MIYPVELKDKRIKLNIGCGIKILDGYINCDYIDETGVDKVFDITDGIPFDDNSVDEILCEGVFAHILNWHLTPMSEIYRVLKPCGTVTILEQYGFSHDPFHVRFFFENTMTMFYTKNKDKCGTEDIDYYFELVDKYIKYILWFSLTFDRLIIKQKWLSIKYFRFLPFIGRKRHLVWILRKPIIEDIKQKG